MGILLLYVLSNSYRIFLQFTSLRSQEIIKGAMLIGIFHNGDQFFRFYDAIRAAIGSPNSRVVGSFELQFLAQHSFFKAIGIDDCASLQGLWSGLPHTFVTG